MPAQNISNGVIAYIKTRANEVVTANEIVSATGLTGEQVRYAMRRILEKTTLGNHIKVVNRGNTWEVGNIPGSRKAKAAPEPEVKPAVVPNKELIFEAVGTLQDGAYVVRSADQRLWRLTAL